MFKNIGSIEGVLVAIAIGVFVFNCVLKPLFSFIGRKASWTKDWVISCFNTITGGYTFEAVKIVWPSLTKDTSSHGGIKKLILSSTEGIISGIILAALVLFADGGYIFAAFAILCIACTIKAVHVKEGTGNHHLMAIRTRAVKVIGLAFVYPAGVAAVIHWILIGPEYGVPATMLTLLSSVLCFYPCALFLCAGAEKIAEYREWKKGGDRS